MLGFETFLIAALALNLTPGADMTFVMANSISQGKKAGLAAALGIGIGGMGHAVAAALGLSALLAVSATAFTILKIVGALYLFWMAIQTLRGSGGFDLSGKGPVRRLRHTFRDAAIVNLTNPKVALFMLAFLPQFVDPASSQATMQILFLGAVFCTTGTIVNCLVAWFASHIGSWIRSSDKAQKAMKWITAGILGGLGVRIGMMEH